MNDCAYEFLDQHRRDRDAFSINQAIHSFERLIELTAAEDHDRATWINDTGAAYYLRWCHTGSPEDLNRSIEYAQMALAMMSLNDKYRASRMRNLGQTTAARYSSQSSKDDLDLAISIFEDTKALGNKSDSEHADLLHCSSIAYRDRYTHTSKLEDLELAITDLQEALKLTPQPTESRAQKLNGLMLLYRARYERFALSDDLKLAHQFSKQALTLTAKEHHRYSGRCWGLATLYHADFDLRGDIECLNLAIQTFEEALKSCSNNHDLPSRLASLSVVYRTRYHHLGNVPDLRRAMRLSEQALDITPEDDAERSLRMKTLADTYGDRFQRFGALKDLERSTEPCQKILERTPIGHTSRPTHLRDLAICYMDRYHRTETNEDKDRAFSECRKALEGTPSDHPFWAIQVQALATRYRDQYEDTRSIEDLEQAIQLYKTAIGKTPQGDPDYPLRLEHLGTAYRYRYEKSKSYDDMRLSLDVLQQALDKTDDLSAARATRLRSLSLTCLRSYADYLDEKQLKAASSYLSEALSHQSSTLTNRLRAGLDLFDVYAQTKNWQKAYDVAETTIKIVPRLISHSLQHADKQHLIRSVAGLASESATAALKCGQSAYNALRLLEMGRAVIIASLIDVRGDVSSLRQDHPEIAERYETARAVINGATGAKKDKLFEAGQDHQDLIDEIRKLPGFQGFQEFATEEEVRLAARRVPIVVINVSRYACDALIVTGDSIRAKNLAFDMNELRQHAKRLPNTDHNVLHWLWTALTRPILDDLGYIERSTSCWPHVPWVPTGLLSRFPIHAAGHYGIRSIKDSVLDRVVSSYATSVRSIMNQQRQIPTRKVSTDKRLIVVVTMTETARQKDLIFAKEETRAVQTFGKKMQMEAKLPPAQCKEVLASLTNCSMFHFAGHGHSDSTNPSQSALLLSDGRLTVESIMETDIAKEQPFLAYLSACETGQVLVERLLDEALHLTAAFQLAGFRHVIGTLWQVYDETCVKMAEYFYNWIKEHGMNDLSVSEGLHHACRTLRQEWIDKKSKPFVPTDSSTPIVVDSVPEVDSTQIEPSLTTEGVTRDLRPKQHEPARWKPYVHFGP